MRKLALLAAAAIAATATPALAGPPAVTPDTNPCSTTYVQYAIACQGYYTGNFFQGTAGQATTDEAKAAIAILLSGSPTPTDTTGGYSPPYALDYNTILAAIPHQSDGDSTFDFGSLNLSGLTLFGAHFGKNSDGGGASNISAVWLLDIPTDTHIVTLTDGKGVSNAQIFATGAPAVPEPATWAMMLMGFGATGVAMRRRRRKTTIAQFA